MAESALVTYTRNIAVGILDSNPNFIAENGAVDILAVLEHAGGELVRPNAPERLLVLSPWWFRTYVAEFENDSRSRLNIALTIGDFYARYVYPGHTGPISFKVPRLWDQEVAARAFMSEILMPRDPFKKSYEENFGSNEEWKLANIFRVSPLMIKARAEFLQLHHYKGVGVYDY